MISKVTNKAFSRQVKNCIPKCSVFC